MKKINSFKPQIKKKKKVGLFRRRFSSPKVDVYVEVVILVINLTLS